jgi:hypothetical protein
MTAMRLVNSTGAPYGPDRDDPEPGAFCCIGGFRAALKG